MSKNFFNVEKVSPNQSKIYSFEKVKPGKKWLIHKFGCADINMGDNISSLYALRFDEEIVKLITVTGSRDEVEVNLDVSSKDVQVSVLAMNRSSHEKEMPFWIEGEEH